MTIDQRDYLYTPKIYRGSKRQPICGAGRGNDPAAVDADRVDEMPRNPRLIYQVGFVIVLVVAAKFCVDAWIDLTPEPIPEPALAGIVTSQNLAGREIGGMLRLVSVSGGSTAHYIEMRDHKGSVGIYVHAGRTVEVPVPRGKWSWRIAAGAPSEWRGVRSAFGGPYRNGSPQIDFSGPAVLGFQITLRGGTTP